MDIELRRADMTEVGRDTIAVTGTRDEVERVVDRLWESQLVDAIEGMARRDDLETWIMVLREGVFSKLEQAIRNDPPEHGEVTFE